MDLMAWSDWSSAGGMTSLIRTWRSAAWGCLRLVFELPDVAVALQSQPGLGACARRTGWNQGMIEYDWTILNHSEAREKSTPLRARAWNDNSLNVLDRLTSPSVQWLTDTFCVGRPWQVLSLAYRRLPRQEKMAREEALDHHPVPVLPESHQPFRGMVRMARKIPNGLDVGKMCEKALPAWQLWMFYVFPCFFSNFPFFLHHFVLATRPRRTWSSRASSHSSAWFVKIRPWSSVLWTSLGTRQELEVWRCVMTGYDIYIHLHVSDVSEYMQNESTSDDMCWNVEVKLVEANLADHLYLPKAMMVTGDSPLTDPQRHRVSGMDTGGETVCGNGAESFTFCIFSPFFVSETCLEITVWWSHGKDNKWQVLSLMDWCSQGYPLNNQMRPCTLLAHVALQTVNCRGFFWARCLRWEHLDIASTGVDTQWTLWGSWNVPGRVSRFGGFLSHRATPSHHPFLIWWYFPL